MSAITERQTHAGMTRYFRFHGLNIQVSADNQQLMEALHSRLRHFAADAPLGATDIVFEYRDVPGSRQHPFAKPNIPMRPVYQPELGEVAYSDGEDLLFMELGEQFRALCSPQEGIVRISILGGQTADTWLPSHPLFTLPFIEMLKRRGRYNVHAAGFALNGQGLLFPGSSGVGKSTLALALLRARFGFLSDDMLFLSREEDGLRVHAFPDEIDVTDQTVTLFPELQFLLRRPRLPGWQKRQVLAEHVYEAEMVNQCKPAVLIFPQVTKTHNSTLRPMSRDEALFELAPNILLTESRSSQAHLDALTALVKQSTAYRLDFGRDFDALGELLQALLD